MKIAIPAEKKDLNSPVCLSFGRAPFYLIYDTSSDSHEFVDNEAMKAQGGAGIKAALQLVNEKVLFVITFRAGENAAQVLQAGNIKIYKALEKSLIENVQALKENKLEELTEIHAGFHHVE